jgi:hypothetical protein
VRGKGTLLSQPLLPFLYLPSAQSQCSVEMCGAMCFAHGASCKGEAAKPRGYSSVARAVALQAIGLGFKSPYLQSPAEE